MLKINKEIITEVSFLLALKNGFNNVSIKEIQKASGFSAGSIYYHFKDKNEILLNIINSYLFDNYYEFKESIKNSNDPLIKKIENIFYYLLDFNKKEFKFSNSSTMSEFNYIEFFGLFFSIYHQHPETRYLFHELHTETFNFHLELIQDAVKNKEIRDDVDIETLSMHIHTTIKGYLYLCVFDLDISIEKLIAANLKLIDEITRK